MTRCRWILACSVKRRRAMYEKAVVLRVWVLKEEGEGCGSSSSSLARRVQPGQVYICSFQSRPFTVQNKCKLNIITLYGNNITSFGRVEAFNKVTFCSTKSRFCSTRKRDCVEAIVLGLPCENKDRCRTLITAPCTPDRSARKS